MRQLIALASLNRNPHHKAAEHALSAIIGTHGKNEKSSERAHHCFRAMCMDGKRGWHQGIGKLPDTGMVSTVGLLPWLVALGHGC